MILLIACYLQTLILQRTLLSAELIKEVLSIACITMYDGQNQNACIAATLGTHGVTTVMRACQASVTVVIDCIILPADSSPSRC